jgi:hypothetical protein
MEELGAETLDLVVDVASGHKSVGEKAGHSQVQLWRNWRQVTVCICQHLGPHEDHTSLMAPQAGKADVNEVKEFYTSLATEISNNKRTIQLKPAEGATVLRPCTFSAWRRGGEAAQRDGTPPCSDMHFFCVSTLTLGLG